MTTNLTTIVTGDQLTMSSLEIAELVEKRHDNVKRTIQMLSERGVIQLPQIEEVNNNQALSPNSKALSYVFYGEQGKRDSIVVVAQLSPEFTARLVDRWQELEQQQAQAPAFVIPTTLHEALRLAADLSEQKDIALAERDEAIRTRHLIGSKREAQAMNKASQAAKKIKKLEAELDRSNEYATIKKMESVFTNQKFSWRKLKAVSEDLDLDIKQIPDKNRIFYVLIM